MTNFSNVCVVIIGRNEGERLKRCLESVNGLASIYVDSGSTDGSVEAATSLGAAVLPLDLSRPFTAARARNEGFFKLLEIHSSIEYVMFVDGDCEIVPDWIEAAVTYLNQHSTVVAVCGRRKERFPKATIYNAMCDIEWNTPTGNVASCGGDAVYRVSALREVNGFNPAFIAGEEPELCFRLRSNGGEIHRIDQLMTLHDANMTRISQWWRRAERSGYAYYLGFHEHGNKTAERFKYREVKSICVWASIYLVMAAVIIFVPQLLIPFALFISLQVYRIQRGLRKTRGKTEGLVRYAWFTVLGKIPQCIGVLKAWSKLRRGETLTLVEYK